MLVWVLIGDEIESGLCLTHSLDSVSFFRCDHYDVVSHLLTDFLSFTDCICSISLHPNPYTLLVSLRTYFVSYILLYDTFGFTFHEVRVKNGFGQH